MSPPKKILIINIFGIGDVLFTTPVVSNLRAHFPKAFIGYVCNKRAQTVLAMNPAINRLYLYERDEYHVLWQQSKAEWFKKMRATVREIKNEGFDVVLDFTANETMGLLTRWAGIPTRIGFDYKNRGRFLTHKAKTRGFVDQHVVEHFLGLLRFLEVPIRDRKLAVFPTDDDRRWAQEQLSSQGIKSEDRVVGLIPGGGVSWGKDVVYRRWPSEKHAQLADKIIEKFRVKVILLGDSSEGELGEQVAGQMKNRPVSFVGQTTVGQYLAMLARCSLVVLNDGGPLHMAVAAGARTVSLIGPVDENVYGPYPREGHQVVTKNIACRPCYRYFRRADCQHINCLRTITVDEVLAKVEVAIAKK